jgi:ABC-2 type transport system permease protein
MPTTAAKSQRSVMWRSLLRLHWLEMVRNRSYFIFVLIFPFLMMGTFLGIQLLIGSGSDPNGPDFGKIVVPMAAFLAISGAALTLTAGPLAQYREMSTFRVLASTPLRKGDFLVTHLLVRFLTALTLSAAVFLVGFLLGLIPAGSLVRLVPGVIPALALFLAVGYLLGGTIPSSQVAMNLGTMIQLVALFLTGTAIPFKILPAAVAHALSWSPAGMIGDQLFWVIHSPMQVHSFGLATLGVVGLALVLLLVAVRTFRWETRRR